MAGSEESDVIDHLFFQPSLLFDLPSTFFPLFSSLMFPPTTPCSSQTFWKLDQLWPFMRVVILISGQGIH
jgi:hypothetical protein